MSDNKEQVMSEVEQEYLTFSLQGEEYGINILFVQEIRVWNTVTELPNKPDYIKGVINLRGVIIPIIDLRQRFGQQPLIYDDKTVMIILRHQIEEHITCLGIVVDEVSDVYKIQDDLIRKAPSFGYDIEQCFIKGLAEVDTKLLILLDEKKLLNDDVLYQTSPLANDNKVSNDSS